MEKHVIINIGRQFGSGGKSVAAVLGERLGIPVYDSELLLKASEESGLSPAFFRRSDERKRLFGLGYSQNAISGEGLFKIQSDVIRLIAKNGSAIFVGRASDYVLRDMTCLNVFITAPLPCRCERVAARAGISIEEASRIIARKDKARESWYNFFTMGHWGVASTYDLCIDSSLLGIEKTAESIIDFAVRAGIL